jgi:hypothetical protein
MDPIVYVPWIIFIGIGLVGVLIAFLYDRNEEKKIKNDKKHVNIMAVLSMFYGIVVSIFFRDNRKHHLPHIHVRYQDDDAVFTIPDGQLLERTMRPAQTKLVQAWITIHADELLADWELAVDGNSIYQIAPLK